MDLYNCISLRDNSKHNMVPYCPRFLSTTSQFSFFLCWGIVAFDFLPLFAFVNFIIKTFSSQIKSAFEEESSRNNCKSISGRTAQHTAVDFSEERHDFSLILQRIEVPC